jgi:hypothetical protein
MTYESWFGLSVMFVPPICVIILLVYRAIRKNHKKNKSEKVK